MLKHGRQPSGAPVLWSILAGALLLLGLVTGPGHAQSGPGTIRIDTDLVSIDVSIRREKANGRPAEATGPDLPRLTAEDFIVREDGVRQRVVSFAATEVPFNLVLLIDTSGSTREDLDLIRRAARRFFDALRPDDRLAIVQFNREVELVRDLTADRARLEQGLALLQSGTGTSFYDALQLTIEDVLGRVAGRKVIVVLTDGVDSYGSQTWEKILPIVEAGGTTIHALRLETEAFTRAGMIRDCRDPSHFEFSAKQLRKYQTGSGRDGSWARPAAHCRLSATERTEINRHLYETAERELDLLAGQTDGRVFPVERLTELEEAYLEIASGLRNVYTLSYYPTNERHDGRWRRLQVEVRPRDRFGAGLKASTRPGYRAKSP